MFAIRLAVVAVSVVAVAGCGSSGHQPAPIKSPSPARFETPQDVVGALEKAGLTCTDYQPIENATGAVARGRCDVGGKEVDIGVYASHADAAGQLGRMETLGVGADMVTGDNWTVASDDPGFPDRVARVLGGKVDHVPSTFPSG
jgi:hypothetical protein